MGSPNRLTPVPTATTTVQDDGMLSAQEKQWIGGYREIAEIPPSHEEEVNTCLLSFVGVFCGHARDSYDIGADASG